MTNLLDETIDTLAENDLTLADVLWVGTRLSKSTWNEFALNADFAYDAGYGAAEVNENLIVVGASWWLERWEYAGNEGWMFKTLPETPPDGEYWIFGC